MITPSAPELGYVELGAERIRTAINVRKSTWRKIVHTGAIHVVRLGDLWRQYS